MARFYRNRPHIQYHPSCEVCDKPAEQGFYVRFCRMFHNQEFLCRDCCAIIDKTMGEKFLAYLEESNGNCLLQEFDFAESRLGPAFERARKN